MMCFYNDGYCDFYSETVRAARKPHRCCGCSKPIVVGSLYVAASGKYEGNVFHSHTCGACELTRFRIHLHELHEGCDWNESWCPIEELSEYCGETDFECSTQDEGQWHLRRKLERQKQPAKAGAK